MIYLKNNYYIFTIFGAHDSDFFGGKIPRVGNPDVNK
jgi:hypothetical protein